MKSLILFLFLSLNITFVLGQISVPNTSVITQNFNGMLATVTLPSNWKMHASTASPTFAGGSASLFQQASSGSPTTGGTYNWGSSTTERAAGAMTSGSFASPNNLMSFFRNTHPTDNINQLTIDYNAERYRINSAAASIQFFYSLDGSAWTAVTAGDISAASIPTGASSYTFATPLTITKTGIIISSLNIAPNGDFYLRWNINTTGSNSQGIGIDNVNVTAAFSASSTITTGTVSTSPFTVDCLTAANGTVDFTSTGTITAGNIYTAQLSNASGSFTAPIVIGSISSNVNSGTISISIPSGTPTGSGYLIRIIASTPSTISSSSSTFSVTLTGSPCILEPPHLTSVIINSCDDGLCSEGNNEIVFGTSGGYSFNANTTNFNFLYGSANPGTNYTDVLVANASRINELNIAAGCGNLFIDANGTTIPANANWMLVSTSICEGALTWNGLCGLGNIYVIFQNDGDWQTNGNFANNPSAPGTRYYKTSITTTLGSTFNIDYTTDGSYPDSDGVFASFHTEGGAATSYGDNNCILTPTVLPTGLINYYGYYINSKSELTWQTATEQNNSHFTLSHSTDGYEFKVIGTVMGAGNSTEIRDYRFIHNYPHPGMNYYKLKSTDYDGKEYSKGIVAIEAEFNFSFYNSITSAIQLSYESDIEIYTTDGKMIQNEMSISSIPFTKSGLFFIYDKKTGISERLSIP